MLTRPDTDLVAKKSKRSGKKSSTDTRQPEEAIEVEQKYDLPTDFEVPDLEGLPGVATVDDAVVHDLEATYFDTVDYRLLGARRTLRRRTGGSDAGWHLKEPGNRDGARRELTLPLGRTVRTVPAPLSDAVAVHTRGRRLAPIARLDTTRRIRYLRAQDGAVVAEVMVDRVEATRFDGDGEQTTCWSELEVELPGAGPDLVQELTQRLTRAGAQHSANASKLARALGRPTDQDGAQPADTTPLGVAAGTLMDYVTAEIAHLKDNDPLVRADQPDSVHQMRVACRRLRSALATFRPLLDRSVTDPVREDLKWIAGELGRARDAEVIRDHLVEAVSAEPVALRRGPVVRRIRTTMNARYRRAHAHGLEQLRTDRYYALLDSLDALLARPPLLPGADELGRDRLVTLARRTWRRVRRLQEQLATAQDTGAPAAEQDELLHEIRKAAKRARYAGEALTPVFGAAAAHFAEVMSDIQSVLGAHQDSVVIREELLALADAASAAGESAFTYGRLHALAQASGESTREEFAQVWVHAAPMATS